MTATFTPTQERTTPVTTMSIDQDTMAEIEADAAKQAAEASVADEAKDMIDEAVALAQFKRKLRIESLKAKDDMGWCVSGTNERLDRLGLRRIGDGIQVVVQVPIMRTAIITLDAESTAEAEALLDEAPEMVLGPMGLGNTWGKVIGTPTVSELAVPDPDWKPSIGDPDLTTSVATLQRLWATAFGIDRYSIYRCEKHNTRHGYCSLPAGHLDKGYMHHVVGNGSTVVGVWRSRTTSDD